VQPASTCDEPTIHVDVYPTLLEAADAAAPAGYTLDGTSMVPLFRDGTARLARDGIYQHFPGFLGAGGRQVPHHAGRHVQAGDWKLMEFFEDNRLELYNLKGRRRRERTIWRRDAEKAKRCGEAARVAARSARRCPRPHTPSTDPARPRGGQEEKKAAGRRRATRTSERPKHRADTQPTGQTQGERGDVIRIGKTPCDRAMHVLATHDQVRRAGSFFRSG
jgi:hypothetical protein